MFVSKKNFIFIFCFIFLSFYIYSEVPIRLEKKNVRIKDNEINIELLITNKTNKIFFIPSREYYEHTQKSGELFIRTFTKKEKIGDLSHRNDIQYKRFEEKKLAEEYHFSEADISRIQKDSNISVYQLASEIKPEESLVLFFQFKFSELNIEELNQVFVSCLYYEYDEKQKIKTHFLNIKLYKDEFNINSFNKYEYIPLWETDTIYVNNGDRNDCY